MQAFRGTGKLVQLALKSDRLKLGGWLLGLTGLQAGFVNAIENLLESDQEIVAATALFAQNPALRIFALPLEVSFGGFLMLRTFTFFAILVALMSILAVVRHTRANEESGRAELVGSSPVGRYASLSAALIVTVGANLLLVGLITAVLLANGLAATGALAAAAALGGIGIVFAGITAVCAQLSQTARGAAGLGGIVLGTAFALSSAGSVLGRLQANGLTVEPAFYSWLTPIGWGQLVRPFAGEEWWVLTLFGGGFVLLVALAFVLAARRDLGEGILSDRAGRGEARPGLLSATGLAWRLQRGSLVAWAAGIAAFGTIFGAMSGQFEEFVNEVEQFSALIAQWGGSDVLFNAYTVAVMVIVGIMVAFYIVLALLRLRREETTTLEALLATSLGRSRWLLSHAVVASVGAALLLMTAGAVAGLAAAFTIGDSSHFLVFWEGALIQLPAVLVMGGFTVLAFGLLKHRGSALAWAGLAVIFVTGPLIGPLLDLPQWLLNISPFTHTPSLPIVAGDWTPLLGLTALALSFMVLGVASFRRRDIDTGA